uniref:Retrotransposon gag domain-containing protein n=1 Tax=Tanacetum cinerariifolium TaxID=118510 RepID=A0A6L2MJH0_TANCI|nr:hypothetical protein [Tanacetum cinerariifolium]
MTRSSTKELFTPFEDLEQEFCSSRNLFKTLSLDESSSLKFNLSSNLKEHYKGEIAETITKTMEEYTCKTQGNYGSGVTRPKIDDKAYFELKDHFLKELHDNTFSGLDHEDVNEHIEKVLEIMEEINDFLQEPNETLYRAWERFKELLMRCPQHYLTNIQEVILFYNGLDVPTKQILDSKGAILTMTANNAKITIQQMAEYSQKWHNRMSTRTRSIKTSDGLASIQA